MSVSRTPGGENTSVVEVSEWLGIDIFDGGFEILNNLKLVLNVTLDLRMFK